MINILSAIYLITFQKINKKYKKVTPECTKVEL